MTNSEKALECLAALSPSRAVPYESWIAVGMALHSAGCSVSDWIRWHPDGTKNHARTCQQKWNSFGKSSGPSSTIASLVKWAKEDQPTFRLPPDLPPGLPATIGWDTAIPPIGDESKPATSPSRPVCMPQEPVAQEPDIDLDHLPPEVIPDVGIGWPAEDLIRYLEALYKPDEICAYVMDSYFDKARQKWNPCSNGIYGRKVEDIIASVRKYYDDVTQALGTFKTEAGAWCRLNPMDGKGTRNENVVTFRHVLAESDTIPMDKQLAIIRALNLPCSAIVHSGGKSIHAIVRIDAGSDAKLFRERVDYLFGVLARNGFQVDKQCRNPSRLSRIPGVCRGEKKQYLISGPCGSPSWAHWEASMKADTDPLPTIRSIADYATPKNGDDSELLKNRFLCRGGSILLVGPTGIGKSSFVMQAAFRWALGQPFFEIYPARELKILIIQAENDDGDIAEIRDGVFSGLIKREEMFRDDPIRIAQRVSVVCCDSLTGREFGKMLDRMLDQQRPDLVIIDPALAYLGGDALKQADVTHFCREVVNPIIHRHQVGLLLIHHTNKPIRGEEKSDWKAGDLAYLGQGAADWANWARGVMAIRTIGSHTTFDLCLGKRGGRIGWKDENGRNLYTRYIAHAKEQGSICWREPTTDEVFEELSNQPDNGGSGSKKRDWADAIEQALDIARQKVRTRSQLKEEIMRHVIPKIDSPSAYDRNILGPIRASIDDGKLEEVRTHDGSKLVFLIGPAGGAVGKRRDEIETERKAKKQRELSI